ncbi:hypothetical protein ACWT_3207 [Actinoplanes sp. SE50]|nr:uncharacterized protein ACPL_3335 [Actinoplanes sp. SE50/110]ATO82622.1 hypothetical protein ACWT_3207 [Actinoplanes sp. SE50]SLM00029.1 hypothetical protein ACSP50_3261 [Actinoplanes sp. SE50/110]
MTTTKRMARITGLAYLGLALSGMLGFLLIRDRLYIPDDAAATAASLITHERLARLGIVADLAMVLAQAATAVCFWKLFRPVQPVAAGSIAGFGLVNCVTILVAVMFSTTALDVALHNDATSAHQALLLYHLNTAAFSLSGLFFGLWLIPMGWLVIRSGYMPRPLGWLLIGGGLGYPISVITSSLAPAHSSVVSALTMPATAGELWMVGYLLIKGVSDAAPITAAPTAGPQAALP